MQGLSSDLKQFFLVKNTLLTSVHNNTDNADDYNRMIGIALLKAFSCAKKWGEMYVGLYQAYGCYMGCNQGQQESQDIMWVWSG